MNQSTDLLLDAAKAAAANAHCPYSGFAVGAAVALDDGQIVSGCNVENASYGLTICAERNALFAAVARGYKAANVKSIVIYTPGNKLHSCCGACRQVMTELMDGKAAVELACDGSERKRLTVADGLPDPFRF